MKKKEGNKRILQILKEEFKINNRSIFTGGNLQEASRKGQGRAEGKNGVSKTEKEPTVGEESKFHMCS